MHKQVQQIVLLCVLISYCVLVGCHPVNSQTVQPAVSFVVISIDDINPDRAEPDARHYLNKDKKVLWGYVTRGGVSIPGVEITDKRLSAYQVQVPEQHSSDALDANFHEIDKLQYFYKYAQRFNRYMLNADP